ncbi:MULTISPECIES: hypothetical protein [Kamptonema]|uniref:hypothetical protein n=1 Tax=Kamptonema TaxID=1501433 RepID=UPI0001DAC2A2|nr:MULTISPECIES: hypothetical protein [Kamptonema]CBN56059.1 hypothetical protein OSCI_2730004 [Kamptonema sp. PCC 6506]
MQDRNIFQIGVASSVLYRIFTVSEFVNNRLREILKLEVGKSRISDQTTYSQGFQLPRDR